MIIDSHTHIFPAGVKEDRDAYLRRDHVFQELYGSPRARVATADELLRSMDEAGVDRSVACGFAWSDAELCRRHNDELLEAAARSGGRIVPFCTVQPGDPDARREIERCAAAGARGIGELRPLRQGYRLIDTPEAALLAGAAQALDLALLFHVSEPVGHEYPGKAGLPFEDLAGFVERHPHVTVIAAHWGGGLPFYALMPELRRALARTYFDTAASSLLYEPAVYRHGVELVGADRILFGSDYPLVSQRRALELLREAPVDDAARSFIAGENARRLLRLADD